MAGQHGGPGAGEPSAKEAGWEPDVDSRLGILRVPAGESGVLVCLSGELDVDTADGLREVIVELALRPEDHRHLLLDLSEIAYCDNASLFTLLGICSALQAVGIQAVITKTGAAVRTRINHTDLADRLPLAVSQDIQQDADGHPDLHRPDASPRVTSKQTDTGNSVSR
ncbi:STAS domain-containing protein [Streptomyces sp. NPDC051636]|uniref:STAS domain-containing protein n=1 Tax=Streptomyces sp. NPDC051636 TaxID=3365663 RepID=UPI00379FFBB5